MKILKILSTLLIMSILSACSSSQLSLKIIDSNTKEPIPNAYVYIDNNLHLSDALGKLNTKVKDSRSLSIYAGKDEYFFGQMRINSYDYPRRNGLMLSTMELYPLPHYPEKKRSKSHSFYPSRSFTEKYIENTPNMKEFLTYLLKQNISVYNFSDNDNVKYSILNICDRETNEPIANCYVLATKRATLFSPPKSFLLMTNEQGYLDIPVDFLDSLFFIKDEYHYATTQITKYDKNQKERTVKLNKATKGKSRNYLSNNCLKISAKLLSEYPHNKILQNFISCLKSQDIIIAKLPENEIVEF